MLRYRASARLRFPVWQALLDDLSELARPPDRATFEGVGDVNLTNLTLDGVGLMMVEEIVQRLTRHWKIGTEQKQATNTGAPPGTRPGVGTSSLNSIISKDKDSTHASSGDFQTATAAPDDLGNGDDNSVSPRSAQGSSRRGRSLLQGGGEAGTGSMMYANAFRLVFGNFFDFVEGARRFIATLAAEANSLLINVDWIRDLAILATAPLDNIINSNWLPLPQSIDQLRTLLQTALNGFCTPESLRQSQLILGDFQGPTFSLAIIPASCPIKVDVKTGRRSIDWENCTPAQLQLSITPATYTGARYTAPVYTGKYCRYTRAFGTDETYSVGGGSNSYTFRRSARQLDIIPVLNQFFVRGLFSPFVADNLRFGNVTGGPIFEAVSTAAPTTANGSNTAFILRSATESAEAEAYLSNKLIAIQDDAPVQYAPAWPPRKRSANAGAVGTATTSGGATVVPSGPQRLQQVQAGSSLPEAVSAGDTEADSTINTSMLVVPYHVKQVYEQMPDPAQSIKNTVWNGDDMQSARRGADAVEVVDSHSTASSSVGKMQMEEQQVLPYKPKAEKAAAAALPGFDKAAPLAPGPPSPGPFVQGDSHHRSVGDSDTGVWATSDTTQGRQHVPVTAGWNQTYTDWLLGVVDQAFGVAGG
ncbi:hypothetical protein VaNZ11_011840 [Volvox africanus]|uniref:Uncharacterized protein n=1 Tax=Volvox africanus TaxID=51714 RepID=A0ABQ5SDS0_9CHLO|nr:hypothetical protein VaNZ11_011840 [Volvox africanus]